MRIVDLTLPVVSGMAGIPKIPFYEKYPTRIQALSNTNLILDGEMFRTEVGRPIILKPAPPLSFVRLAA